MHGLQQTHYVVDEVAAELYTMEALFHREFLSTFLLILTMLTKTDIV